MTVSVQSVVAGSKGFVDAMGATLRIRLGAAPRVARDPADVVRAGDAADLVVVECGGPEWLGAVKDLRTHRDRGACAIVAALPAVRMTEAEALRAAGADEAVRWDGRVDPVVWAVDRVVAARARSAAASAAAAIPVLAGAAGAAAPGPALDAAFELRELGVEPLGEGDVEGPLLVPAEPAPPAVALAAVAPEPAELPVGDEVEALLAGYLRGGAVAPALRASTEALASKLGELERAALLGDLLAIDPAPLRRGAALRWTATAVLVHARAAGCAIDPAVARALPAEIDAALAALQALVEGAPEELRGEIGAARNALVSLAVELTDAMAGTAAPAAVIAEVPRSRAPTARVLSNEADCGEHAPLPRAWIGALAAAVIAVGGWHAYRAATHVRPSPPPTLPGAPAHTYVAKRGASSLLMTIAGATVDPAELEKFKAQETARGNAVVEVGPGVWSIGPSSSARGTP